MEISPVKKDLGILIDEKLGMTAMCACSLESQLYHGLRPQQHGHRVREGILPLCPALLRPPRESCVQLWSPEHRTDLELWERGQRRPQQRSEGWRKGWEN